MKLLVHKIKKYIKILRILFSISTQLVSEYRVSFFLTSFTIALWLAVYVLRLHLIFLYTDSFAQYSIWQYLGFLGFYFFVINLFWFFFEGSLNKLSINIYEGVIDRLITKPVDSQFIVSFYDFNIPNLFNLLVGLVIFIVSLFQLGISVSILQFVLVLYLIILFIVSVYSLMFSGLCMTFWAGRLKAMESLIRLILDEPANVPASLYQGFFKVLFYFILPIALISTVPTNIFYFEIEYQLILYYSVFTLIAFGVSRFVWKRGLKTYSSVSS